MTNRIEKLRKRAIDITETKKGLSDQREINMNDIAITNELVNLYLRDDDSIADIKSLTGAIDTERGMIDEKINKNTSDISTTIEETDDFIDGLRDSLRKFDEMERATDMVNLNEQKAENRAKIDELNEVKRILGEETSDSINESINTIDAEQYDYEKVETVLEPFDERINQTPINNGKWSGDRGNSIWYPDDEDVLSDLRYYGNGAEGIHYYDGYPDFTPVQVFECGLPHQLYNKNDNYQFTDCNLALLDYLKDYPDSVSYFDNVQLSAIARGQNPIGYTWHHDVQAGRMQLVPTSIHGNCFHYGGRSKWGGGTSMR